MCKILKYSKSRRVRHGYPPPAQVWSRRRFREGPVVRSLIPCDEKFGLRVPNTGARKKK